MNRGFGFRAGASPGSRVASSDEGVERVRLARFGCLVLAGGVEDLVDDRLDRVPEFAPCSTVPRARRFQAPSASVQSRREPGGLDPFVIRVAITGRARLQAGLVDLGECRGLRGLDQLLRACRVPHSRRWRSLRPRVPTSRRCGTASDTTGCSVSRFEVSSTRVAAEIEVPEIFANCSAVERQPALRCPPASSTRQRHQRLAGCPEPLGACEQFEHLRRIRDRHIVGLQVGEVRAERVDAIAELGEGEHVFEYSKNMRPKQGEFRSACRRNNPPHAPRNPPAEDPGPHALRRETTVTREAR